MEAIGGAVVTPGRISGWEVVQDLCDRIAERLLKGCDLRPADSYSAYSARIQIALSLIDVDQIEVVDEITIGDPNSQSMVEHISIDLRTVEPEVVAERLGLEHQPNLERTVDGSEPQPDGVPQVTEPSPGPEERRWYTPRGASPGALRRFDE